MLFKRSSRIIDMDVRNSNLLTPQNGKPSIVIIMTRYKPNETRSINVPTKQKGLQK